VLLLFHLLAPGSLHIIGERAIDTVVGCALAIAASRLFPYWEYRDIGKLVTELLATSRQHLEAAWWWGGQPGEPAGAAAAGTNAAVATERGAPADRDFRYRLARKNAHIAFANLAQALRRMLIEPEAHRKFVPELNDLLVQAHTLAAQITAAVPLIRGVADKESERPLALQRTLSVVRENLANAHAADAPSAEPAETTKQLTRELDAMVTDAERSAQHANEFVQELKMLALQAKQMLAASFLIRKDARTILLSED